MDTKQEHRTYQPGDVIELTLDSVAFGGESIGRHEGCVVFVLGGIEGETISAEVMEVKKNFIRAALREVLNPSPHRVRPECAVYGVCGGCQYQHVDYAHQLILKQNQVRETLERLGGLRDAPVLPAIGSFEPYGYRSRVEFHVRQGAGGFRMGFVETNGRNIVDVAQCPISTPGINQNLLDLRKDLSGAKTVLPGWVKLIKFWDAGDGVHAVWMSPRGEVDLHGKEYICINVCSKKFYVPLLSFFQVNLGLIETLVSSVEASLQLDSQHRLLDAYCGVGLFAITLASRVKSCLGIEADQEAVRYARRNAAENGIVNCAFLDKSVDKVLKHPERYLNEIPDRVILDPTRAGCERRGLETLSALRVERLVYVSCNPATFARDAGILCSRGYRLESVQPIDLFPQTRHCELVASLEIR